MRVSRRSPLTKRLEKHEQAVQHAEKAVEIEPEDTFNWTALCGIAFG